MEIHNRKAMICFFATCALVFSACESEPTGSSEEEAYLQASIQSLPTSTATAIDIQHHGGANWSGGTKHDVGHKLQISSRDRGTNRDLKLIQLSSEHIGPFEPGVYTLVPRNFTAGDNDGYTAFYGDSETGNHYIAETGTWTITDVSEDGVVSGHFDLVAAYWCNPHNDRDRCFRSPADLGFRSDAVRLHVHGEFRAEKPVPVPVW